jgi:hypothetical protein
MLAQLFHHRRSGFSRRNYEILTIDSEASTVRFDCPNQFQGRVHILTSETASSRF